MLKGGLVLIWELDMNLAPTLLCMSHDFIDDMHSQNISDASTFFHLYEFFNN